MKSISQIFKLILNLDFKIIKKKDVILLDDNYSSLKFENLSYEVINFNKLNFFCLIKSLFSFLKSIEQNLSFKEVYLKNLYKLYSPKVAISHHLNKRALLCKYLCPNISTITYQFSYINNFATRLLGLDSNIDKKYKNCDYFCIYHESDKKIFEKYFKSSYVVTGSIKNNEILLEGKKVKSNYLTYISEYTPLGLQTKDHYHIKCESFIVKMLSKYCLRKNFILNIALRSDRKDKKYKLNRLSEINYFKYLIGDNFNYSTKNSYELASESNLIVCLSSNMGIELLARKYKVLFLPYHDEYNKEEIYPYIENLTSPFIHRNYNEEEIINKIDKLIELDFNSWDKTISNCLNPMVYDKKNSILKQKVFNLCKAYDSHQTK